MPKKPLRPIVTSLVVLTIGLAAPSAHAADLSQGSLLAWLASTAKQMVTLLTGESGSNCQGESGSNVIGESGSNVAGESGSNLSTTSTK